MILLKLFLNTVIRTYPRKKVMRETILVAEDQRTISNLIEYKLKNSGYNVIVVEDGLTALKKAKTVLPNLILLDIMMPLMTGFEVLADLKNNVATKNIPVIIISAQTREEEIVKGLALGADDYILKPFSPNEVLARIKTVLLRNKNKK
jgi:two-component system alkaline phosphatase synthesis response regulator PhoP